MSVMRSHVLCGRQLEKREKLMTATNTIAAARSKRFRYAKDHLSKEDYESFFADCKKMPWDQAMDRLLARPTIVKARKIPQFLSAKRRNDFIFLLPIKSDSVVLDYGSGWGNTSYTVSQYCGHVVAMEGDSNRLRFSASHFWATGRKNIAPLLANGAPALPFADGTFDAVIMNGVLEWTATAVSGVPGDVHRRILSEIHRVLKPGGSILVAIENRYSFKFLLGTRDHHAGGLRWASALPRWLADLYSRVWIGRPYRTWFYGYRALNRLFADAGFESATTYGYHPHHVSYTHLFNVDDDANSRCVLDQILRTQPRPHMERLVYRLCRRLVPFRTLVHDFAIVARKAGPKTKTALDPAEGNERIVNLRSMARNVLLTVEQPPKERSIVKFPREDSSSPNITAEASCLKIINSLKLERSQVRVPKVIECGTTFGRPFVRFAELAGSPIARGALDGHVTEAITEWLIELAQRSRGEAGVEQNVSELIDDVSAMVPSVSWSELDLAWLKTSGLFDLPTVFSHGDLSPNNILKDQEGHLSVVDWEFGSSAGLPLTDLIDFLLYIQLFKHGSYREAWVGLFHGEAAATGQAAIGAYCQALNIDRGVAAGLIVMFLLGKIRLLAPLKEARADRKLTDLVEILRSTDFRSLRVY